MTAYAILVDTRVVPCNAMTWARWFEASSRTPGKRGASARHVGDDDVNGLRVSTVFMGLDHSWGVGPPLWFETMIFGSVLDGLTQRYTTWEQAEAGHAFVLALAKGEAAIVRDAVAESLARIARAPVRKE